MNGLVKVPMQFFILLIGILIFSFYQYSKGPVYFDEVGVAQAKQTIKKDSLNMLEAQYSTAFAAGNMKEANAVRKTFKGVMERALPG